MLLNFGFTGEPKNTSSTKHGRPQTHTWKRCHDSTASEESCSKAMFSEPESGSSKGKFQRGKLATKTSRNSKGKASQYQDEKTTQTSRTAMYYTNILFNLVANRILMFFGRFVFVGYL